MADERAQQTTQTKPAARFPEAWEPKKQARGLVLRVVLKKLLDTPRQSTRANYPALQMRIVLT